MYDLNIKRITKLRIFSKFYTLPDDYNVLNSLDLKNLKITVFLQYTRAQYTDFQLIAKKNLSLLSNTVFFPPFLMCLKINYPKYSVTENYILLQ